MSTPYIVIMAGGRGERFWPRSRQDRPKQLLPIVGDEPMLTQTVRRLGEAIPPDHVFVITNAEQRKAVCEICPDLPPENIVGEPVGRDTAAAVGLAALLIRRKDPKAVFAVLPADHIIHDQESFRKVLKAAAAAATQEELLVTIGITPASPATGYGYIHAGPVQFEAELHPVHEVHAFKEKPDEATAKTYVESGEYYWNAGMFVWRTPVILQALENHAPGLHASLMKMNADLDSGASLDRAMESHYPSLEKISIDFAIMEKADNVAVIPATFDWDDVGEWPAIARHEKQDSDENTIQGNAIVRDSRRNIVVSSQDHLVTVLGVEDLIVVHSSDATLICHRSRAQDLKELVREVGEERADLI